ncbi:class I SAM-dependent methyltransferase [Candidatus Saccharibacteria bacterium]|nr:class I SAM-dependent methyltransferase [Candidatus Saccharibacteria bacterium]
MSEFKDKPIKALELGSYEGRSSVWMLENILTHPHATLRCVDFWGAAVPFVDGHDVDWKQVRESFYNNIKDFGDKVSVAEMKSADYMLEHHNERFDLIYVDADHSAASCLTDAVLAHHLLNPGGIIIFDDYLWSGLTKMPDVCKGAIDAFMECYSEEYIVRCIGYQVFLEKKQKNEHKTQAVGQSV